MRTQTQNGIELIPTPKGMLAQGHLPGIENLDVQLDENHVIITGTAGDQPVQEIIPIPNPINTEASIITYHDHQLRMVMPWRNEQ